MARHLMLDQARTRQTSSEDLSLAQASRSGFDTQSVVNVGVDVDRLQQHVARGHGERDSGNDVRGATRLTHRPTARRWDNRSRAAAGMTSACFAKGCCRVVAARRKGRLAERPIQPSGTALAGRDARLARESPCKCSWPIKSETSPPMKPASNRVTQSARSLRQRSPCSGSAFRVGAKV